MFFFPFRAVFWQERRTQHWYSQTTNRLPQRWQSVHVRRGLTSRAARARWCRVPLPVPLCSALYHLVRWVAWLDEGGGAWHGEWAFDNAWKRNTHTYTRAISNSERWSCLPWVTYLNIIGQNYVCLCVCVCELITYYCKHVPHERTCPEGFITDMRVSTQSPQTLRN